MARDPAHGAVFLEAHLRGGDRFPVLIAFAQNGRPMPVRERGPLWVIYPLDSYSELQNPVFHARMIWQLRRIVVG